MTLLRWWLLVMVLLLAYVAGQNQGMNKGWDSALAFDPQCKSPNQCFLPRK